MSNESKICVICQDDTQTSSNPFMSPCKCKGSVASIHRECLEQWMVHSGNQNCSVCRTKYRVRFTEEIISTSPVKIIFQTIVCFLFTMTVFTVLFRHTNNATYKFDKELPLYQKITLYYFTTYLHMFIHFWYSVFTIIIVFYVIAMIVSIIGMFFGETPDIHMHDTTSFFDMAEYMFSTYPFVNTQSYSLPIHFTTIMLTIGVVYSIYQMFKYFDTPIKKVRIQI